MTKEGLAVIQQLAEEGDLSPARVVEEARSGDSPLHGLFDWDDAKAAHAHRLQQARAIIRSVRVEYVVKEHVFRVPKYVHDTDRDEEGGYVETFSLVSNEEKARRTIQQELKRAIGCLRRAEAVAHAVGMRDEVSRLIAQMVSFQSRDAAE